nr:hypothetical protein [Mesorhizobium sp.]
MGFEKKADAEEILLAFKGRLAGFGLTLREDKTRLIEFRRFSALSRQRRGERRPETFAFLGFTHYGGRTRDGRFFVKHKTEGKGLTRKLTALRCLAAHARHWLRSTDGSPPFCVDTTATTAGRTSTQRPRIPSANAPDMATVSETAQPEKPEHGLVGVRDPDGALSPANSAHHSNLGASKDMTRVTLGMSRVRESARPDL